MVYSIIRLVFGGLYSLDIQFVQVYPLLRYRRRTLLTIFRESLRLSPSWAAQSCSMR